MNYEEFKEQFKEQFQNYLPAVYAEWVLEISEMPKVNGYREAVTLRPKSSSGCTPVMYMDELYAYYRKCNDFAAAGQKAAAIFVLGIDHVASLSPTPAGDIPKESVIYSLVPGEKNARLLNEVPHRMTMDLALLYRICIPTDDGGFDSAIITHDMAEEMGLSEEELYQLAVENTPKKLPLEIRAAEECLSVITNEKCCLGAAAMMYPGVLEKLADDMESDLFILPASIHEIFVVPDIGQSVEVMNQIVEDANWYMGRKDEYLSSHVYYYQRDCNKVFIPPVPS